MVLQAVGLQSNIYAPWHHAKAVCTHAAVDLVAYCKAGSVPGGRQCF